jgi:hypothetical protein
MVGFHPIAKAGGLMEIGLGGGEFREAGQVNARAEFSLFT